MMHKLIISFLLILVSLSALGQNYQKTFYVPNPRQELTHNITVPVVANGWGLVGNTCAGCASYYFKVTKTNQLHRGEDGNSYYYYYIWFFSNSYYSNGQQASAYLTNVSAYMNGQYMTMLPYVLVTRTENYFIWLRSSSPYAVVTFTVNQMSVY